MSTLAQLIAIVALVASVGGWGFLVWIAKSFIKQQVGEIVKSIEARVEKMDERQDAFETSAALNRQASESVASALRDLASAMNASAASLASIDKRLAVVEDRTLRE